MRTILLLLCLFGVANAETKAQKDTMGYTHYSDPNYSGLSNRDTMGTTHFTVHRDGETIHCYSRTNTLGTITLSCP
jgi:hypothetical protein